MIYKYFVLLALLISMVGVTQFVWAQDNCNLAHAPRDSGLNASHGYFLFIYPREISDQYTGCQTMFNEEGNPLWELVFKQGQVVTFKQFGLDDKPASIVGSTPVKICRYPSKSNKSNDSDCPPMDQRPTSTYPFRKGFLSVPKDQEPVIPPGRDLRRK